MGCITPITALVAMAASAADPPSARIVAPACEARGCSAATIPRCETTMERPCDQLISFSDRKLGTAAPRPAARVNRASKYLFMGHLPGSDVAVPSSIFTVHLTSWRFEL